MSVSSVQLHIHTGKHNTEIIKKKIKRKTFLFVFLLAPTPQWTQITIYSDLHIFKIPPGAPQALLLQEGWRRVEERGPGAGCSETSLGRSGAGRSVLAACARRFVAAPVTEGWEKACFLGGSMFDAWGKGRQPVREDKRKHPG